MSEPHKIFQLDLDAFFCAVEAQRDPARPGRRFPAMLSANCAVWNGITTSLPETPDEAQVAALGVDLQSWHLQERL